MKNYGPEPGASAPTSRDDLDDGLVRVFSQNVKFGALRDGR